MEKTPLFLLFFSLHILLAPSTAIAAAASCSIGVNYGFWADNLPPPAQVAAFLKTHTTIDRIKIFDANPDVLRAFANTGISVTVTVANADVPSLAKLPAAQAWIANNILPFHPQTTIRYILVGNEVLYWKDKTVIAYTLPAMKTLHHALHLANLTDIRVSTPHALSFLAASEPPSTGMFRRFDAAILRPILDFHNRTKTPFMVNPYPFFGFRPETLDYAVFRPNRGLYDKATRKNYTNMFDEQMDAIYIAMKKLGNYEGVEIVIAETGWPSAGDPNQPGVSLENALSYNGNVVKHVNSGKGTPLMPNRTFETYIFALFNENLKASVSERNYGLFKPDFSPVYDVGVMRSTPAPANGGTPGKAPPSGDSPAPAEKKWCVPRPEASDEALQRNLDYVCSLGVDCRPIQSGGPCFSPNTVRSHASYAMNAYYQSHGREVYNCDFEHTGVLTSSDPSYETCSYPVEGSKMLEQKSVVKAAASSVSARLVGLTVQQMVVATCFVVSVLFHLV
ncbi:unnamed protein product [Linum tenue]|uniref:glucan endo-1,3-beta-D-glucosidase n=1 Tax=Linum tenue TaxID=586396 RepID=A0AAV0Q643_9ROSI|nr:unnamed protein product [Linum tenue]